MISHFRSFLIAAGILAAAAFQPVLHAQGFGGMFSGLQMGSNSDDDEEQGTNITAAAADIDLENNIITLIGNVVVDDGTSKITCNKMTIYLEEEKEESEEASADSEKKSSASAKKNEETPAPAAVTADGKGADDNGKDDDDDEEEEEEEDESKNISKVICQGDVVYTKRATPDDQIAMSEQAEYDAHTEEIVMTGGPGGNGNQPVMMQGGNKMYGDEIKILIKEGNRMRVINPNVQYIGKSILSNSSKTGSNR